MTHNFNRNVPGQLYLSIIPAGVVAGLAVHAYRHDNTISKFYTWRSAEPAPDNIIDGFENEFTNLVTQARKVYKNVNFHVSMISNLEARTYGSFGLNQGAEFQIPLLSAVNSVKELKTKYPNLLTVVHEMGLQGDVNTSSISDSILQSVLLSDAARHFCLRREILQAESFSHIVIPAILGSSSFALGYPIFSLLTRTAGPAIGFGLVVPFALYFTYHILKIEAAQRVLAMDNRVLEKNAALLSGAKQYLQARIAFGKLLHKSGNDATKVFNNKGDCSYLNVPYTVRLKQVLDIEEKHKQSTAMNKVVDSLFLSASVAFSDLLIQVMTLLDVYATIFNSTESRSKQSFTEKANVWITGNWGRRFRIGLLAGTVVIYPVGYLIANGPLLKYFFKKNHSVNFNLPDHLQRLTLEQLEKFQEIENRQSKNIFVDFGIQKNHENLDSVAGGSLSVRFGAQVALPFYTQFQSKEEALDYCQKYIPTFHIFGEKVPIIWDSPVGNEMISTFVLSPSALRFLILRDMFSNDGYNAYANKAISWATWTAFTSIFTYWMHQKTRMCGGTAKSFAVVYSIFLVFALLAHEQWFLLFRFLADTHGDSVASRVAFDYSSGGKEYYWKMLKRNRILRDLLINGREHITPVGDLRNVTTRLLVRYDLLKDVGIEDDEIRGAMRGDD